MTESHVSIGVAGALGPHRIGRIAALVERAGFHALWVNDTPDGDSLAGLAAAAASTSSLVLATGVIPIDRRPAAELVRAVESAGLPADRLVLGIGSGAMRQGALAAVAAAAIELHERLPGRVMVGALGPRMRRLAVTESDGALLSWLTPATAAAQADELRALNPDTRVALYARTAVDPAAIGQRDAEARRYARYPAYAANFERLGIDALDTLLPRGAEMLVDGVAAYTASVDELILRAITPSEELADYDRFVETAGALLAR